MALKILTKWAVHPKKYPVRLEQEENLLNIIQRIYISTIIPEDE